MWGVCLTALNYLRWKSLLNLVNYSVDHNNEDWPVLLMLWLSDGISNKKLRGPILIIKIAEACQNAQVKQVFWVDGIFM